MSDLFKTKICSECNKELPFNMFHHNRRKCLECRKILNSKYYNSKYKEIYKQNYVSKKTIH
jgi:hypothetical protein